MGEFNVDKTTGGLNPTAGMPETYPAEQVMMSDGVTSVKDALDAKPIEVTKNSTYVGVNHLKILRIGNLVNVSGRFQVKTEKPAGQGNHLFSGLPAPYGEIVSVDCTADVQLLITNYEVLTANDVVPTGYYNVNATYSTIE